MTARWRHIGWARGVSGAALASLFLACGGRGGEGFHPDAADVGLDSIPDIPYVKDTAPPPPDAGGTNHPPVLSRIGDRVVAVGETLTIPVEAADPDGDPLTFSVYGDIPQGAKFDKVTRVFTWVPLQAGKAVYLTFVVSDGTDMDRETVEIRVVTEKTGHPPQFDKVSDQQVRVGIPVSLALKAHDPDGDTLEYGIAGQAPPQSQMDSKTGVFTWTPPKTVDGTIVTVAFVVSDGTYKDQMEVRFLVGDVPGAHPPVFDPVPDPKAVVGKEARFTVRATDPDGQAVTIALDAGKPEGATFDAGTGEFRWTPGAQDAGRTVSLRFSATDGQFIAYLTVKVHVGSATPPPTCSDDPFEPNNDPAHARDLSPGTHDLSICDTDLSPVDADWFRVVLKAGETVSVRLEFEHDLGDIDTDLSVDGSIATILAASTGTGDVEEFEFAATSGGTFLLVVYGVADTKYSNPYRMVVAIKAASTCQDDPREDNDSMKDATGVSGGYAEFPGLVACPGDEDWFAVSLKAGDGVIAAATPEKGTLALRLLGPDGLTVLDSDGPGTGPATVAVQAVGQAGTHYAVAWSAVGARYAIEFLVEAASAGCTSKSCPVGEVCDPAAGKCVLDYCEDWGDCPAGMPCIQTYCVQSCGKPSDCRVGYACKTFPEGTFCGEEGQGKSGAPCTYFSECADDRACLFEDQGGYCAVFGCASDWDCPLDAWCVARSGMHYCAAECLKDADCNQASGFRCQSATSVDGIPVTLCLP